LNLLDAVAEREEFVFKYKSMPCILGFHPVPLDVSGGRRKEKKKNGKREASLVHFVAIHHVPDPPMIL